MSESERGALLALPFRDRGHLPDEIWWAFHALLDAGLSQTDGNFSMTASPLGAAVLALLREQRGTIGRAGDATPDQPAG
ncbi:hypothetical protein [Sphingomonas profundi]|uniref:hypothetical protein n=1 Tax=Alterirhizorhabdus profundi TaxID=2681549 RepID=UPI0012E86BA8|nr:hypothetical protein [Sphingomonas profundi]